MTGGTDRDENDAVRTVAMAVPQPWSARQIALVADESLGTTRSRLADLLASDDLVAVDVGGVAHYYPDPVTAYIEATGGPPQGPSERAAVASLRQVVADLERSMPIRSVRDLLVYHHAARLVASSRLTRGLDVYEEEWDVLVVLDTCRVDALREVIDRLDGPDRADVTDHLSPASQTAEWLCGTFTGDRREEIARTGYVSGNGWVKAVFEDGLRPDEDRWFENLALPTTWDVADAGDFGAVVDAWQYARGEYSPDAPWAPHPDPETVTDHAVALARERSDLDRLVVHFKQPHAPYTVAAEEAGRTELTQVEAAPFDYIAEGGDRADVWEAYLTDLRAALDSVASLCRNVEGTAAITADHGEAFGEDGEYGHRPAMLHRYVRRVPWVTLEASDEGTRDVDLSTYEETTRDVDAQLEALGYR